MIKLGLDLKYSLLITLLLLPVACVSAPSKSKSIHYYTLAYPKPVTTFTQQLPFVLRVHLFSVSPPFNTQRIIYADKGLHRNAYAFHQWIADPGQLLPYLITRDLQHTGGFQAVLTPETRLKATHEIYGWVEKFLEQDEIKNWSAILTLHITLVKQLEPDPSQRILFQKTYHAEKACHQKRPDALAKAMSAALAEISSHLVHDIYDHLL